MARDPLEETDDDTLDLAQAQPSPDDTLVLWRLYRSGRSLRHLIATVTDPSARRVGFRSLTGIDTTTPAGRLVFHVSVS